MKQVLRELKDKDVKNMFSTVVIDTVDIASGLCEKYIPQKNEMTKLYMSLIMAMLAGRIVNGLVNTCILSTQG